MRHPSCAGIVNLRGLSIRQRMQAGFALVVMLTAVACGTNLRESYRQYRQGYLDLRDFALVERAMIASNRISAERWPANQLLALRWRDAATQVQAVRDARARSDQALDALRDDLARAEALGASERGAALHALESIRAELAGARGEVDALAARPRRRVVRRGRCRLHRTACSRPPTIWRR
ncbi:hypothetical protein [Burkholderia contaminans]|uniref:hypothetical protein n=1 Tax=Burkholderia contaminans TaxID=488447 RepID=UPI001CECBAFD|nr:hypothetical protein [Burkholderia contaminans]